MSYNFILNFIKIFLYIVNGKPEYQNTDKIPTEESYVLVAPHITWLDPVFLALSAFPQELFFIAKKEISNYAFLRWLMKYLEVVLVDRDNPGPSVIKEPVRILKGGEKSLLMFPSGTRSSQDLKGGALTIARLSKKPILPAVYIGPKTLKDLFKREKVIIRFGDPFYPSSRKESEEDTERMMASFENLYEEIKS